AVTSVTILSGTLDQDGNPVELNNGVTAQAFLNRALEAQTLEIDAVSGATLTSKALLKALENALLQAY
ncbi:MAG: FMN-binding protein, partial [Clostridiaceae bacterium]